MAAAKKPKWATSISKQQIKNESKILQELQDGYKKALDDSNKILAALVDRVDKGEMTPSVLRQIQYQSALSNQLKGIYNDLYGSTYNKVHDYLKDCYEDGKIQTMYSLHKDGLDMCIPIDQNEVALMAGKSATTGFKLSQNLYTNTASLAIQIREEMTRGIASQASYDDIARNLALRSQQEFNRTMRIARTEGHRVKMQAQMQAIGEAKEKGADVVKQWDSTLDGRTRPTHRMLDGQIQEIDKEFEVNGKKAFYPGGFGSPGEDINCRCVMLERARWAIDGDDATTKWDGTNGELLKSQQEIDTWKDVNKWTAGGDKGNHYNKFSDAYKKAAKKAATAPPKLTKDQQDQIDKLEATKKKIEMNIENNFDTDKEYVNIWKEPVTLEDWKDKQGSIQAKKDYFKKKLATASGADKIKFQNLYDELMFFDADGSDYWSEKKFLQDIQDQIDAIKPQSTIYKKMTPSGGGLNQNCTYKKLYTDRLDADKYYRKWADKTTYALGDRDGQEALYFYTKSSGHMNRPLSGYDTSWYRSNFKGLGKVDWNNEHPDGKNRINALTKLIDKTQPLKEGITLRRGSDRDGLIGLFEGAGFDYDTIKKACNDGSITKFKGSVVKNHAFTSCGIAKGTGFGGEIDYTIKCPAGTKMVYAEPQSYYGATISGGKMYKPGMSYSDVEFEAEMLLQRGTSFRIDKITKSGSKYKIELTVVDQKY